MEKYGLVDKTKNELIDIVLDKEAKEKQLREDMYDIDGFNHILGVL